jgi:hypothetical protein
MLIIPDEGRLVQPIFKLVELQLYSTVIVATKYWLPERN